MRESKESVKFMQVLDRSIFSHLKEVSKSRGVTVQELIRVLVIPDWMKRFDEESKHAVASRRQRRSKRVRARAESALVKVRAVPKRMNSP